MNCFRFAPALFGVDFARYKKGKQKKILQIKKKILPLHPLIKK
jgi:hypothetical protein